jgi:hypothetical protein
MAAINLGSLTGLGSIYAQQKQQLAQSSDYYYATNITTDNSNSICVQPGVQSGWGALGMGMLGHYQPPKRVMSFLEELREEVSKWHGSLGTI